MTPPCGVPERAFDLKAKMFWVGVARMACFYKGQYFFNTN
jgi:hypothetical protein